MYSFFKAFNCFLLLFFLAETPHSYAQTINVTQNLSFGEAVLTDNATQREIVLDQDGSFSSDAQYLFVSTPQPGIYQVTGQTAFRNISSVDVTVLAQPNATGRQFTLDNFDVNHPAATDGSGQATIRVGARLRSSGNGTTYPASTTFNGNLQITVNY